MKHAKQPSDTSEDVWGTIHEYLNLKLDEYKLRGVEGLSALFNTFLGIIVIAIVAGISMMMLGMAAGFALGRAFGSLELGLCTVGAIFVLGTILLYIFRHTLFVNMFIKIFLHLFLNGKGFKELKSAKSETRENLRIKESELCMKIFIKGYTFVKKIFL